MKKGIASLLGLLFTAALAQTHTLTEGSEARFYIDEVLLGSGKTVVGITQKVTGELSFDPADPRSAHVGVLSIDARDLTTDDDRRNRKLRNDILASSEDAFQFITFAPTAIAGLPETVAVGDSFEVQLTGDLTIKGVTREEVFTVSVTVGEKKLQGVGSSTIQYADYDISVPRVPIVASVADEVRLELEFVAVAN